MASEAVSETVEPNYNGSEHHSKVELLTSCVLTEEEEESVALFMSHVNSWRRARGFASLSRESSVKFLMARKFTVDRAIALYRQHESWLYRGFSLVFSGWLIDWYRCLFASGLMPAPDRSP